jgi:galactitol-specific phosphotransferase system IIC component
VTAGRRTLSSGMPSSRDLHRGSTQVMSVILVLIGVAMIVSTIARGGGVLALGIVLGLLFVAAGAGRLYVSRLRS